MIVTLENGQQVMERGIIFSPRLAQETHDGIKTKTRRVLLPQPPSIDAVRKLSGTDFAIYKPDGMDHWGVCGPVWAVRNLMNIESPTWNCPYGKVGDRLWVREAWRILGWHEGEPLLIQYRDGSHRAESDGEWSENYEDWSIRMYEQSSDDCAKANVPLVDDVYQPEDGKDLPTRWRPSIHMPRWCSRTLLEITDIRVERVSQISNEDALAEGIERLSTDEPPREIFFELWDSINKKRGYGIDTDPWVWAITYRRVS
ncbi:MAG: hypothetical protein V3V10_07255 [Planctomycetota bacterium]